MYTARLPSCIELPTVVELSPPLSSQRRILNYTMKLQKTSPKENENSEKLSVQEGGKSIKMSLKECE
jgi:hypothetical protein